MKRKKKRYKEKKGGEILPLRKRETRSAIEIRNIQMHSNFLSWQCPKIIIKNKKKK